VERPSPRNTCRRVSRALAVLCALVVCGTFAVSPLAHADDLHKKKQKAYQAVEAASGIFDDSSKALTAANNRLAAAKTQLDAAERQLAATQGQLTVAQVLDAQMQAKLVQAEQALVQAEQDVANGEAAVKQQRADIGELAAADFQYGDPRLVGLSAILTAQDPEELTVQINTADSLMNRETNMLDDLNAREALLKVQKQRVEQAKAEVAEQRRAAAANLVRMQALERAAAANRAEVATLVSQRAAAAAQARTAMARDARKLAQAKREEARIKRLILARAKHHRGGSFTGDSGGFLYRPVPGWITSPFGWRIHPIYGYWGFHNGDDFHAPCGSPEHAGAAARVVSEYYSSVWGNRLFLDVGRVNGKTMVLIYNHISGFKAHTGDHVSRGEVVSYAGTTGWSTGCHLHFTVMLNGVAVDPVQFF
jgi:murein DD-endopeptidase MepM/ murein hydrolase activator NlpD